MDSRSLIEKAYGIATMKGKNQSKWSADSGHAVNGQTVNRILRSGECKLSTFISLLEAIGCSLEIKED